MFLPALGAALLVVAQPPPRAYVGAYLTDVSDFDLKAGRFKADLRVWLKWSGAPEVPALTFENGELESKDELLRETDGDWHSVQYRVQGTFRGDFPVNAFPFDVQTLPVVFGLAGTGSQLVPDLGASGMSPRFSVTGWLYEPYFNARTFERTYGSDLGSIASEGKNATLPRVAFTLELRRPIAPYMFKFILPLSLILLMALTALLLPPRTLEVRTTLGVTSLLSCIAFHYTQADTLPNVTYLVAADKLFLGAYSFVALTMLASVVAFRSHEHHLQRALRLDRLGLFVLPASATALTLALVLTAMPGAAVAPKPPGPARPSQPVLKVAAYALDTLQGIGGPQRRGQSLVKAATGLWQPVVMEEAPSMTNAMVRLLPEGGMRVRWRLLPDARWSDGPRITTDDLLFSLNLTANPLRTALEAVDDRTVDVTWARRRQEWLDAFPLYRKALYAPAFADGGRDAVVKAANEPNVPSTGPYAFKSFTPGQALVLERNPHYPGPPPIFERVEVVKVDAAASAEALLSGTVDVLPSLDAKAYAALVKDGRARVLEQPGELLYLLVPNLSRPPWNALDARRALLSAIDRAGLVSELQPLPAEVATAWRSGFRDPRLPAYAPDDAAKAFEALGLKGQTLQLHVATLKLKGGLVDRMVHRLAADLTRAGLEVQVVETSEAGQLFARRDFDGLLFLSRDTTDPSRLLNVPFENGHSRVEEPAGAHFDAAMVAAWERYASSLYEERRVSLEQALQRLWVERLPMLPLVLTSRVFAVREGLEGPRWGAADSFYWNVQDWQVKPNP